LKDNLGLIFRYLVFAFSGHGIGSGEMMGLKVFHHLSMKAGSEDFTVTVAAKGEGYLVFGHFFSSLKPKKSRAL